MVKIEGLTYDYPSHRALHNISFSIPQGSVTALVGPNGAGKTTLMRCMAGLTRPLSGSIEINNQDVLLNPRKVHQDIGFLADFFGLYDKLTIYQSLNYFAQAHDVPENLIDQRINRLLKKLNLEDKIHTEISHLSRGMRQRVAIGQTMIHEPKFLILDEPASGLDPEARHELAQLFKELNQDGITIMVSSHILSELDEYSNNLLIIKEGRIVENDFFEQKNIQTRKLVLKLSLPHEQFEDLLKQESSLSNIYVNDLTATFDFDGDEKLQSNLMISLIQKGLMISSLSEEKVNLQDKYLDTLKQNKN